MFRSEPMSRVELVVPERDIVALTETLAASRVFHVAAWEEDQGREASPGPQAVTQSSEGWLERATVYAALEQRILDVMTLLAVDAGEPPDEVFHLISPDIAERDIDTLEEEAREPVQELEEAYERLDRLRRLRRQLDMLMGLDIDLSCFRNARYLFSMLGTMPSDNVERLETSLEHVPSTLVVLAERSQTATVVLFGLRRDTELLVRAARSAYLNPFELPEAYAGSPEEAAEALDRNIERLLEQIAALQATLRHLHETRIRRLRHLLWRLRASRKLTETVSGFRRFQFTYLVAGWVPGSKVESLRRQIADVSAETVVEVRSPNAQEQASAPFEFSNPPVVRIFEPLVVTYGYPKYTELDPTPLLALTFPLIFGIMFGDVGHGLFLVLLGGLIASGRVRPLRGLAGFGRIIMACGVTATVFGALYGSVFGFEDLMPALWLRPLERATDILLFSIGFGAVTLTLGMVYNIVDAATARIYRPAQRWGHILLDRNGVAGVLFYWSLLGLGALFMGAAIPVGTSVLLPIAILSGALIALADVIRPAMEGERVGEEGGVLMTITEGFFELFETLLGLMSNTLSYVRMGAFAVAHGALSLVVFILATMVDADQSVAYWIVVVLGNIVVIAFEGMIVGIQTLRLEYYEFFSKFFEAGGEPYRPLSLVEDTRL